MSEKQKLLSIKQVEYFLNLVLQLSFERDLQKRVNCLIHIIKSFKNEFPWFVWLGDEYLGETRFGADDLLRAEVRFHREFEKLAGVFIKILKDTR